MTFLRRLRNRLALIYAISALLIFLIAFGIVFIVVRIRFTNFVSRSKIERSKEILLTIAELYDETGNWRVVERISRPILQWPVLGIKIKSSSGKTAFNVKKEFLTRKFDYIYRKWGMRWHNQYRLFRSYSFPNRLNARRRVVKKFKFYLMDKLFGKAYVTFPASQISLNLLDQQFLKDISRLFYLAALFSVFLFSTIAFRIGKSISRPIEEIVKATLQIAQGDMIVKVKEKQNVLELEELSTSFNQMTSSLMQKKDIQSKMTSDIAHELRTPITILKSHLEGMHEGVLKIDNESIHSLLEETYRLEKIINDLKSIWLLEITANPINFKKLELVPFITDMIKRIKIIASEKKVSLSFQKPTTKYYVKADKDALIRIVLNILSNAIKFSGQSGKVNITIEKNKTIDIKIKDNGPGIPEKEKSHIFERFYRIDTSRSRKTGGTGLGLSIAREAALALNSDIHVYNNPDKGCTFVISMPIIN